MVVKKPVVKKRRKVKKGKQTKALTKTSKGGNVSQVVNVFVNKQTRQRRTPTQKQFIPQIQPKMYNAGQDNLLLGLQQQNKTLMDILNRQRIADTTPNTDILTLDDIVNIRNKKPTPSSSGESTYDTIYNDDDGFNIKEKKKKKPKNVIIDTPSRPNVVIDTTSRQNISNMLSSIAEGMSEIPQSEGIQQRIFEIGDQVRPKGVKAIVSEIDDLDEIYKLEIEYDDLVKQLQEQKKLDNSIKMSNYTSRLPKKVSKLKEKIAEMKNTLATSRRMVQSATPV